MPVGDIIRDSRGVRYRIVAAPEVKGGQLAVKLTDAEIRATTGTSPASGPADRLKASVRPDLNGSKVSADRVQAAIAKADEILGRAPRRVTAAAGSPATAPVESHESFMRRLDPAVADRLGYGTPYVQSFLMGYGGNGSPVNRPTYAGAPVAPSPTQREDAEHAQVMATFFPQPPAPSSRRARIHHYA